MNRRKFLAALAAGGIVTAEGLWVPGAKLISIPKAPPEPVFTIEKLRAAKEYLSRHDIDPITASEIARLNELMIGDLVKIFHYEENRWVEESYRIVASAGAG